MDVADTVNFDAACVDADADVVVDFDFNNSSAGGEDDDEVGDEDNEETGIASVADAIIKADAEDGEDDNGGDVLWFCTVFDVIDSVVVCALVFVFG